MKPTVFIILHLDEIKEFYTHTHIYAYMVLLLYPLINNNTKVSNVSTLYKNHKKVWLLTEGRLV